MSRWIKLAGGVYKENRIIGEPDGGTDIAELGKKNVKNSCRKCWWEGCITTLSMSKPDIESEIVADFVRDHLRGTVRVSDLRLCWCHEERILQLLEESENIKKDFFLNERQKMKKIEEAWRKIVSQIKKPV